MIDMTNKHSVGGKMGGDIDISEKSHVFKGISPEMQKQPNINLELNFPTDTDSEDNENSCSSEDENDCQLEDNYTTNGTDKEFTTELTALQRLVISENANLREIVQMIVSLKNKYMEIKVETDLKEEDLKARGHTKNGKKPRSKPYDAIHTLDNHHLLLQAVNDKMFIERLKQVSLEELEKLLVNEQLNEDNQSNNDRKGISPNVQQFKPQTNNTQTYGLQQGPSNLPQMTQESNNLSAIPPFTQAVVLTEVSNGSTYSLSPQTSPYNNNDMNDSSYETGSPCSSGVTSPGSPHYHFSPPRTSISSESDYELDIVMENCPIQLTANTICILPAPTGREVKPIGEIVQNNTVSATQRLFELSKSSHECGMHFTIQLVRAVMSTTHDTDGKIDVFCKNLVDIMKNNNKPHIWKLSIYAHIEFLVAPDRVGRYWPALHTKDCRGRSLLYIAAVERYESPIIARYIAESIAKAGCNPCELDKEGNTILHLLAEHGDSHVHVMSELLMATDNKNKPLFSVSATNNAGQTPLHVAVQSPKLHLSTVLYLLKMRACPFQKDKTGKSALHYHILYMARQRSLLWEEMELVRKMLQSQVSISKELQQELNLLLSDTSIPKEISKAVLQETNIFLTKDPRPKRNK